MRICVVELYQFCLDIATPAWGLYTKWQKHQGFSGSRLHAIARNKSGEIVEVPDGILFPIIAAHACFIKKDSKGKWVMTVPEKADKDLIAQSATELLDMVNKAGWKLIALPRVGTGNGQLLWGRDVKPILEDVFGDDPRFVIVDIA